MTVPDTRYPRAADSLADVARLRAERNEALALLADAPDHADMDAAVFDNNNLRAENARLRAALVPVVAAFQRVKHLDHLLSDEAWLDCDFMFQRRMMEELWQAVKATARQAAALVEGASMSDETRYPRVADLLHMAALREENRRLREALRGMLEALPEKMALKIQKHLWLENALLEARNNLYKYSRAARQAAALVEPPTDAGDG